MGCTHLTYVGFSARRSPSVRSSFSRYGPGIRGLGNWKILLGRPCFKLSIIIYSYQGDSESENDLKKGCKTSRLRTGSKINFIINTDRLIYFLVGIILQLTSYVETQIMIPESRCDNVYNWSQTLLKFKSPAIRYPEPSPGRQTYPGPNLKIRKYEGYFN